MAVQHKIFLRGKIGNVIFYEREGIAYAREAPHKVRQTKGSKESAQRFGKAARIAKTLRTNTGGLWQSSSTRNAMHRLNKAVLKWLMEENTQPQDQIHLVTGFEFNPDKELISVLKFKIGVTFSEQGEVTVTIPAFEIPTNLKAPPNAVKLHWHIFVNTCRVADAALVSGDYHEVTTPVEDGPVPGQTLSLQFNASPGCITVVGLALNFSAGNYLNSLPVMKTEWMPMQIIAARYR